MRHRRRRLQRQRRKFEAVVKYIFETRSVRDLITHAPQMPSNPFCPGEPRKYK